MIVRPASGMKVRIFAAAAMVVAALPGASLATDHTAMMRLTIDGLVVSQTNDGLFPYGFDFLADKSLDPELKSAANLIRQAGAVSVLAAYYRHTHDARLLEPIRRSLTALARQSLPDRQVAHSEYWIERTYLFSLPVFRWKLQSAL